MHHFINKTTKIVNDCAVHFVGKWSIYRSILPTQRPRDIAIAICNSNTAPARSLLHDLHSRIELNSNLFLLPRVIFENKISGPFHDGLQVKFFKFFLINIINNSNPIVGHLITMFFSYGPTKL